MGPDAAQRYLRQMALPEVGPDGQERIAAGVVAVAAERPDDLAAETAGRYLAAAGVGTVRFIGGSASPTCAASLRGSNPDVALQSRGWPADGPAWLDALHGCDLIVRSGFDDDPMLRAAVRLGIPAVVLRARAGLVELVSFRRQGPCPHVDIDIPPQRAQPARDGAAAVVAGTLGAGEALFLLLGRSGDATASGARHLALPLDGGAPRAQEIPWSPACFGCGGSAVEMVFP